MKGFAGFDQDAEGTEVYLRRFALGFFAPDFGGSLDPLLGNDDGIGEFQGGRGEFDGAGEAELEQAAAEALAGGVIAEDGIGGVATGGEPAMDAFDDLRDAAAIEAVIVGDFPLLAELDFDELVDVEIALGGWLERAGGAGRVGVGQGGFHGNGGG